MKNIKLVIGGTVGVIALVALGWYFVPQEDPGTLGATNQIAGSTYYLAGSGMSSTATSFTLTSFTIPQNSTEITDSDLSDTFYVTVEPGNRNRQEIVGCTTVVQNADDTATISGCTRGLSPIAPYTETTSLKFAHGGGSIVILSDPPQLFEQYGALDNDEVITGAWQAPDPSNAQGLATKSYVDDNVNGGAVTLDGIAVGATAGETFATGTIVYFDLVQTEWMKASATTTASSTDVLLGIAQGPGTDGVGISGGVLTRGYDQTNSGGTAGQTIYLSDTDGATTTSAGTVSMILGVMKSTTEFYFDPVQLSMAGLSKNNTFTGTNLFSATTTFTGPLVGNVIIREYSTPTTTGVWTKPDNVKRVFVEIWGAGGGGAPGERNGAGEGSGGGGGGAYNSFWFDASLLSATTSYQIGTGGNQSSSGTYSSFNSTIYAYGGGRGCQGDNSCSGGGGGGIASAGAQGAATTIWGGEPSITSSEVLGFDIDNHFYGGGGGSSASSGGFAISGGAGGGGNSGPGGSSMYGCGGGGGSGNDQVIGKSGGVRGSLVDGGGGTGGAVAEDGGDGTTFGMGGGGGGGDDGGTADAGDGGDGGTCAGGGAGGSVDTDIGTGALGAGGTGGDGYMIITEVY